MEQDDPLRAFSKVVSDMFMIEKRPNDTFCSTSPVSMAWFNSYVKRLISMGSRRKKSPPYSGFRASGSVLRIVISVVLVGLVAVGCTNQEPGNATSSSKIGTISTTTSTAQPNKSRPQEIKLNGIDPCKVLTTDQMQQLTVVEAERNDSNIVKTGDVPTCSYGNNTSPRITYGVGLVTTKGIEYWRGNGNVDVEKIDVSGYAAVQLTLKGTSTLDCAVAVDVADGQQLYVDFSPTGQQVPQEQMCDNARRAAEFALTTLPTLT